MKHEAGKGDRYRPVNMDIYRQNYELIFNKGKKNEGRTTGRNGKRQRRSGSR